MEKAIEIKRRAQRCIQNGDLEGALSEYEKLVGAPDSDPYNYVLLADLLYKKGDQGEAAERYLSAVSAYQGASLYKNAIAVCKKMVRLSLSPAKVLQSLANLHALDGLVGEAALYYVQYAEHLVRTGAPADAAGALRQAFDLSQDNVRVLEQLSEAWLLAGEGEKAAQTLMEAAAHYQHSGLESDARRCEQRATQLSGGTPPAAPATESAPAIASAVVREPEPVVQTPEPGAIALDHTGIVANASASAPLESPGMEHARLDGFETGRHHVPDAADAPDEVTDDEPADVPVVDARSTDTDAAAVAETSAPALRAPIDTSMDETDDADAPREFVIDEADLDEAAVYEIGDETESDAEPVYSIDEEPEAGAAVAEPVGDLDESTTDAVYEIGDDAADLGAVMPAASSDEPGDAEAVYEIDATDTTSVLASGALDASEPEPADAVYVIDAADESPAISSAPMASEPDEPEAVYEIDADTVDAIASEPAYEVAAEMTDEVTAAADEATIASSPSAPGLVFPPQAETPASEPTSEERALAQVEELLVHAQTQFRAGERDEASMTLAQAAQVCESIGRLENAATIYRSLGRGPHATSPMLELWLANCERRNDPHEAGQVACELGDRALNDGDEPAARTWFQRAIAFDGGNETAIRRLHRLEQVSGEAVTDGVAVATTTQEPASNEGRVEVAVGRAEAVSFDLAGLLAEFQRGVEAQLAGDAQGQYDLGMTYREMGLHEQAMEAFRAASRDPRFAARALEMAGRCLADQGQSHEAVGEFRRALEQPGIADGGAELRYHLGRALEDAARHDEALAEYVQVQAMTPGFEDVDQRVDAMRRWLGRE